MKNSKIREVSKKQAARQKEWSEVTHQRIQDVDFHCEWCGKFCLNFDGHHKKKRSRGRDDSYDNCFVCDRLCHIFIEDKGIDVRIIQNLKEYNRIS